MKKLIAKFLHWCLRQIGYTETYHQKHHVQIHVSTNTKEAIKELKMLLCETEKLVEVQKKVKL